MDGKPAAAIDDLDRAEKIDPQSATVWLERGLALSDLRRDPEADQQLTRYLASETRNATAYSARGYVRERMGKIPSAIQDFSLSLQWSPDPEIYLVRGRLQEQLRLYDDAARGYRAGLLHLPGSVVLQAQLIHVERLQKHFEAAIKLIDEQLAMPGNKSRFYLLRAEVCEESGNQSGAQDARRRALEEADRAVKRRLTAMNLYERARVFLALGRDLEAATDLEAAWMKSPRYEPVTKLREEMRQRGLVAEMSHDKH